MTGNAAPPAVPFDPLAILATLFRHRVRFVVIGGFAAQIQGSPSLTADLDVCPAWDRANLRALAHALDEMGARRRGPGPDLPVPLDAGALAGGDWFTLGTRFGNLDLLGRPTPDTNFETLERTAERFDLDGLPVLVASVDDLIRLKRAAGRPKDLIEVEVLGALRDELDRRGPTGR